jgi:predicted trehalose synthase
VKEPEAMPESDRCKPLNEWLTKHDAARLWQHKTPTMTVEAWQIGVLVAIIQRYGKNGEDGWGLFTQEPSNNVAEALVDAEERLGIVDENDTRLGLMTGLARQLWRVSDYASEASHDLDQRARTMLGID